MDARLEVVPTGWYRGLKDASTADGPGEWYVNYSHGDDRPEGEGWLPLYGAAPLSPADISNVWIQAQENHRYYSATGSVEGDIRFHALGLAGEAGEVANFVKKRWRDHVGHDVDLRKEVADVCAYAFMLADALGMTPQDLIATIAQKQAAFIEKMRSRSESKA